MNLSLDVLGARGDGFHEIRTVFQAVDLFDTVTFLPDDLTAPRLTVTVRPGAVSGLPVPTGSDNLALHALCLIEEEVGCRLPLRLHLCKRIPVGGGLGGGSSDAAAVLWGASRLAGLTWDWRRLTALAARLGSDVPFFVRGGTALGEGRGEQITRLPFPGRWPVVLVRPPLALSTAAVYAAFDALSSPDHPDVEATVAALHRRSRLGVAAAAGNALEEAAFAVSPELRQVRARLESLEAMAVVLSGSGPTFFLLARTLAEARRLARAAAAPGWFVRVTRFYHRGVGGENPAVRRRQGKR